MPLYFFDTFENGRHIEDDVGVLCQTQTEARTEAMKVLPAIAKDAIPKDSDQQAYSVTVRDEGGRPVYSATLTFAGMSLSP